MQADLEWFRTFKAVYEKGTMSEAAKELNRSQPGVALHLNSLETYVGYPLFNRTPRKLTPTQKGRILYQQLHYSLSQIESIEKTFQKGGDNRPTISIGMFPGLFHQLVEQHLAELPFNMIAHLDNNTDLLSMLERETVDLVLSTTKHPPIPNIKSEKIGCSRFILVAGKRTDLSAFPDPQKASKDEMKEWLLKQLWYSSTYLSSINTFWKLNFGKDADFAPNFILPDTHSTLHCVSRNPGVAVLPDSLCRNSIDKGDIKFLWAGYKPMLKEFFFLQHAKSTQQAAIDILKKIITEEFNASHPPIII